MLKRMLAAAVLALAAGTAEAGAAEELGALLSGHAAARADFTQFTLGSDGGRAEESTGHFIVARPDRFRWVTDTPFMQEIVSDGEVIWIHDPDLEQVTRKPAGEQDNSAPALILNGQIEQLRAHFDIVRLDRGNEAVALYELTPRDPERSTFARIRLLFEQQRLSELSLEDSLGQRSMLVLHNLQYDPELPAGVFDFVPPEGADVILDPGQ